MKLALVFELMEKNLYEVIKDRKKYLPEKRVKKWMYQILKALDYMHRNGIFHRDIKPENILLLDGSVKLADLGSCKGIYCKPPFTEYISTRWYRSPECLLTDGYYNFKMDIWGLGCVFFEMLTLAPLFPGDDEIDEVNKINQILGSPSDELFQKFIKNSERSESFHFEYQKGTGLQKYLSHCSNDCVDLIEKMLIYDPDQRYSATKCLNHPYFRDYAEIEKKYKMSQASLILNLNDSIINNKLDDSLQIGKKSLNKNNSNSKANLRLPKIKQFYGDEDSKDEESSFNNNDIKKNMDIGFFLPKISKNNKYFGDYNNVLGSLEFKQIKHNLSNRSIDKINVSNSTQYGKKYRLKIQKRIKDVQKYYISPYSKKNIDNNMFIV